MANKQNKRAPVRRVFLLVAFAAASMVPASPASAADASVKIDNFTFDPPVLTVKAGTTVTWNNVDDIPHTVASSTRGLFKSKALDTADSFSFTFKDAGTFDYFCSLHPHMTGTIRVEAAASEVLPPAAAAPAR
jgi:plastocyanin